LQRQLLSLPEATIMTFAPPTLPGLGNASGFDLRILAQAGQSSAELEQVTRQVLQMANQHPQLSRVFTTWSSNVPQLTLTVDRDRAARLDVPVSRSSAACKRRLAARAPAISASTIVSITW
jgi:multidrug efflux pump subunit AcrB